MSNGFRRIRMPSLLSKRVALKNFSKHCILKLLYHVPTQSQIMQEASTIKKKTSLSIFFKICRQEFLSLWIFGHLAPPKPLWGLRLILLTTTGAFNQSRSNLTISRRAILVKNCAQRFVRCWRNFRLKEK